MYNLSMEIYKQTLQERFAELLEKNKSKYRNLFEFHKALKKEYEDETISYSSLLNAIKTV